LSDRLKRLQSFLDASPGDSFILFAIAKEYEKLNQPNEALDHYLCPEGKVIPFKKVFLDHRTKTKKKEYRASKKLCIDCPLRKTCLKKSQEKRITVTYYRAEYERNNQRINSKYGRQMKALRQSRVEPVFGILTQFLGMRKINVRGLVGANKCMHLAATAYNLKKLLKYKSIKAKSNIGIGHPIFFIKNWSMKSDISAFKPVYFLSLIGTLF